MGITDILSLLGGLALFLYGMQMTSSGLEAAAGVGHETVLKGTPVEPLKHQLP